MCAQPHTGSGDHVLLTGADQCHLNNSNGSISHPPRVRHSSEGYGSDEEPSTNENCRLLKKNSVEPSACVNSCETAVEMPADKNSCDRQHPAEGLQHYTGIKPSVFSGLSLSEYTMICSSPDDAVS